MEPLKNRKNMKNITGAIQLTKSQLQTLKTNSSLKEGAYYYMTDLRIGLFAINSNTLSVEGYRIASHANNTAYQPSGALKGIFVPSTSYSVNDNVVWGGRCWRCIQAGTSFPVDDATLNGSYFITTSANMSDIVFDIKYDWENEWVFEQSDKKGNVFIYTFPGPGNINTIEISDWGCNRITNNKCQGIFNNSMLNSASLYVIARNNLGIYNVIKNNSNNGFIYNNSNNGGIYYNSNNGVIYYNSNNGGIYDNLNNSLISSNSNNGDIYINSNNGGISLNSNEGDIYNNSNKIGDIYKNINNGDIYNNSSSLAGPFDILGNNNNGNIVSGTRTASVIGTVVNL